MYFIARLLGQSPFRRHFEVNKCYTCIKIFNIFLLQCPHCQNWFETLETHHCEQAPGPSGLQATRAASPKKKARRSSSRHRPIAAQVMKYVSAYLSNNLHQK